jgi:ubiquinone/menaquinone biosynthesis C-methylase UbiE
MLPPAAQAFDAIAERFDERYGAWRSVAAQRNAVRASLLRTFPAGARLLEIGGGTGEDARALAERGREVLLTDASPRMVRVAAEKLRPFGGPPPRVAGAERLASIADERDAQYLSPFDGAFSNFAALNCVSDLTPVANALARLVRPAGRALLVLFGTACMGEVIVQLVRRDVASAFRRRARGDVAARLGGQDFVVRYHRGSELSRAMHPWFRLVARRGVGLFVPPSAAEPWISGYPHIVAFMERADRLVSRPLAAFGDHVLYDFERTSAPAPTTGATA